MLDWGHRPRSLRYIWPGAGTRRWTLQAPRRCIASTLATSKTWNRSSIQDYSREKKELFNFIEFAAICIGVTYLFCTHHTQGGVNNLLRVKLSPHPLCIHVTMMVWSKIIYSVSWNLIFHLNDIQKYPLNTSGYCCSETGSMTASWAQVINSSSSVWSVKEGAWARLYFRHFSIHWLQSLDSVLKSTLVIWALHVSLI